MKKLLFLSAIVFLAASCQTSTDRTTGNGEDDITSHAESNKGQAYVTDEESTPNILHIAMGSEDHTTLVAAVQAAEQENALANAGPLTVFAPTNAAFEALPEGTVEDLLKPENKSVLADIIQYHATPGKYDKDFLRNFERLGQANNDYVEVTTTEDGDIRIGGAKILGSVTASNGIVHVVDKVLLPPEEEE